MQKKLIVANWKMNMLPNETMGYIEKIEPLIKDSKDEIVICAPFIDLFYLNMAAQGTNIKIGAQNMHLEDNGAYTGEISAKMLKSIGVEYVIIGHYERRRYFGETDQIIAKKIQKALEEGLKPMPCMGETLEEKELGKTKEILEKKTEIYLSGILGEQVKNIIIAYEPIWANGNGKTATVQEAIDTIQIIRNKIETMYNKDIAESANIQYTGSINKDNAKDFLRTDGIDGIAVGGASLDPIEFAEIINS